MTVRRLKTYAGSQGYVYQYYFAGKRRAESDGADYVFEVSSDGRTTYSVTVRMPDAVPAAWAEAHGRQLTDTEQYAAVKLRLFRAFDEVPDMQAEGRRLEIDATFLEESLASLGVE
jgi:hypothetical protein